jgi:hypothetical protein
LAKRDISEEKIQRVYGTKLHQRAGLLMNCHIVKPPHRPFPGITKVSRIMSMVGLTSMDWR